MTVTLTTWARLACATGSYLRRQYEAPLVTGNPNVTSPAWVFSQWRTRDVKPASMPAINQALQGTGARKVTPGVFQPNGLAQGNLNPVQYLIQHGHTQLATYQPASRFWPFQWIKDGWLLALSQLRTAVTVWSVRRRAARSADNRCPNRPATTAPITLATRPTPAIIPAALSANRGLP